MKRVRQFNLIVASESGFEDQAVTGWHKTWDAAVASLAEGACEVKLYDIGDKANGLIAVFSSDNLQARQEPASNEVAVDSSELTLESSNTTHSTKWVSEPISSAKGGQAIWFANLNHSDFGWRWIEGSMHEIPYRLTFIERNAERNPDGICARGLGLVAELRDMLRVGGSLE